MLLQLRMLQELEEQLTREEDKIFFIHQLSLLNL